MASIVTNVSLFNKIKIYLICKTLEKLNDLLCVSMNKDILNELDNNDLIKKWTAMKNRRFII